MKLFCSTCTHLTQITSIVCLLELVYLCLAHMWNGEPTELESANTGGPSTVPFGEHLDIGTKVSVVTILSFCLKTKMFKYIYVNSEFSVTM